VFTEPLHSNDRGCKYRQTDWWEGLRKYTVEIGSGAMIYIPNFIKIGSGIQKLMDGVHRHIDNKVILQAYFFFSK
jgi:hypothetical protein